MSNIKEQLIPIKAFFHRYRRFLILLLTPIILSPVVALHHSLQSRTAYAIAIMAVYWVTEVIPIAVTSLLPLIIFPLLGVLKGKEVCLVYMKDTNILLLGGLLVALAIEHWNVHKRIALRVLLLVGVQPRRLMLGFMLVTAFISMWITNTATTAMMTPIMEAVLKQLDTQVKRDNLDEIEEEDEDNPHTSIPLIINTITSSSDVIQDDDFVSKPTIGEIENSDNFKTIKGRPKSRKEYRHSQLCKALCLCVCYAANIGGTGTLTGTDPQLVLAGQVREVFPHGPSISFIFWFTYAFPQMVLFLLIGWLYLQTLFLGIKFKHICSFIRFKNEKTRKSKELYAVLQKQYEELGPLSWAEKSTIGMFTTLVILWLFRAPKFIPGWGELFKKGYITDGTAAAIIGFLLFLWPSQCPNIFSKSKAEDSNESRENTGLHPIQVSHKTLLNWKDVETKFPWNVLFLLGAGFALAKACDESGLSKSLSQQLSGLNTIPPMAFVFIICTALTFLTEITSNTATAAIFLPVLASLSQSIGMHPFYLLIPATCCTSFAFMLPVATPPNAIVFSTGRLSIRDMAKAGFGINLIGILIVTLGINTWGMEYYGLAKYPEWAKDSSTLTTLSPMTTTVTTTEGFINHTTSL